MKLKLFKKILVVGIVVLFFGITVQPVISEEETIVSKSENRSIRNSALLKTAVALTKVAVRDIQSRFSDNPEVNSLCYQVNIQVNKLIDSDGPICDLLLRFADFFLALGRWTIEQSFYGPMWIVGMLIILYSDILHILYDILCGPIPNESLILTYYNLNTKSSIPSLPDLFQSFQLNDCPCMQDT